MLRSGAIQAPPPKTLGMKRIVAIIAGVLIAAAIPAAADAQLHIGLRLGLAGPDSLGADWRQQQDEAREGVQRGHLVPLGVVIEQIRRRTPGRPLDAGSETQGNRPVYRVRWITTDGRRIDYIIDATSGAILSGG